MFLNLRELRESDHFDYCIIGSGPAGLTLAIALTKSGGKVLILEGGGLQYSAESQSLYKGEVVGDSYFPLISSRLRYFGGTSNHWSGWCRPLDEIDFKPTGARPKTYWPINKADLDPYLPKAQELLGTGNFKEDVEIPGGSLKKIHIVTTEPVRFAEKYADELRASRTISVALNANLVGLNTNGHSLITTAKAVDFDGNHKTVRAKFYILAAGGIENSRILLWSNQQTNGQVVKNADTLGRYWMEHPHFTIGEAIMPTNLIDNPHGITFISPTSNAMSRHGILNCGLRIHPIQYDGTKKLIADIACVAPRLAKSFANLLDKNLICGRLVRAAWEQEPRYENRIELSEEKDPLGIPYPILYWKKSELDLKTVRMTGQLLGEHLARTDTGRLRLDPWVLGHAPYPEDDERGGVSPHGWHQDG